MAPRQTLSRLHILSPYLRAYNFNNSSRRALHNSHPSRLSLYHIHTHKVVVTVAYRVLMSPSVFVEALERHEQNSSSVTRDTAWKSRTWSIAIDAPVVAGDLSDVDASITVPYVTPST